MLSCSLSSDNRDSLKKSEMYLFAEMVVYNKNKFQTIFFVEYGFYFTREVKTMYILFVASPLMKYKYLSLHSMKLKP